MIMAPMISQKCLLGSFGLFKSLLGNNEKKDRKKQRATLLMLLQTFYFYSSSTFSSRGHLISYLILSSHGHSHKVTPTPNLSRDQPPDQSHDQSRV
jgi:hypothetical protein